MPRTAPRLALVASLLLLTALPLFAHNGAVAIAVPVEGITVDGDLSDWPEDMARHPMRQLTAGPRLAGEDDFTGRFRVGYNERENALYIAVEVQDESVVKEPQGTLRWDTQDGCEIYVDVGHAVEDTPPVQYRMWGITRGVYGPRDVEDMEVEVHWETRGYSHEWRLDMDRVSDGQVRLHPGMAMGFDVAVWDRDADGSASHVAFGSGERKVSTAGRTGDVVLVADGSSAIGMIRGTIAWEDTIEGRSLGRVRIQSLETERLWVGVKTDPGGEYAVELPAGTYRVDAGYRGYRSPAKNAVLTADKGVRVDSIAFADPPLWKRVRTGSGTVRGAGPGRVRSAGPGLRQKSFRTFGPADGLPTSRVLSLFQDRTGNLWIGTRGGGVARYDGAQFMTLSTDDGLTGSSVCAIAEDREGNLWFATGVPGLPDGRGVCRYDGKEVTEFDTTDGLVSNRVNAMAVDTSGHLWFATEAGVSRYDGREFANYTSEDGLIYDGVTSLAEDAEGNLWFGMHAGVSRFDGIRFESYDRGSDGLVGGSAYMPAILRDSDGNMWFSSWSDGVSRYDGHRFTAFTRPDGPPGAMAMALAGDGSIWFGHDGAGAYRFDGTGFERIDHDDGLPHGVVWAALADREGHVWLGTPSGLSRYYGDQLTVFDDTAFPGAGETRYIAWLRTMTGGSGSVAQTGVSHSTMVVDSRFWRRPAYPAASGSQAPNGPGRG